MIQENEILLSVIHSFSIREPFQRPHLYDPHDDDTAGIFVETFGVSVKNDRIGELVTYLFPTFTHSIAIHVSLESDVYPALTGVLLIVTVSFPGMSRDSIRRLTHVIA